MKRYPAYVRKKDGTIVRYVPEDLDDRLQEILRLHRQYSYMSANRSKDAIDPWEAALRIKALFGMT